MPPTAAPINSLQQFRVITQGSTDKPADINIKIISPCGNIVNTQIIPTHNGYLVSFTPIELGDYAININFGGEKLLSSPYHVNCVIGSDPSKVRAYGPGLDHGTVNKPAEFIIDTRGAGQGGLGITCIGPCEAAINCRDNGDGTCSVAYLPTESGDYTINITFNETHVYGSPFQAIIVPSYDINKIKVTGNGIQPYG